MAKQKHVLNVVTRTGLGKGAVKRLRAEGNVPAVIYGHGKPTKTLYFSAADWEVLQKFELNLLSLKEGENEMLALIKEVQNDFIRGKVKHVDFLEVNRDEKIRASVAVHPGHEAPAGASQGGMLEQDIHELEVECLPDALPEFLEVNVAGLELDAALHVSEISLPEGVRILNDPELVVFHVMDPSKIVEEEEAAPEAAAEGEAAAEPEVIGEKERQAKAAEKAAEKAEKAEKK